MKKLFLVLIFLVLGVVFIFNFGKEEHLDDSILVVGTNAEYPPFAYVEDGKIIGFDIDLIEIVAQHLGKDIVVKDNPSFDALIPDLKLGRTDIVAAGMTYTEERGKKVAFTKPYISQDPFLIISLLPINELSDEVIVVNEGYTADFYLSEKEGLKLLRVPSPAEAFLALKSGQATAFFTAQSTVKPFFDLNGYDNFKVMHIPDSGDSYSLVVSKDNLKFLEEVQQALDIMEENGTLETLKGKWGLL